MGLNFASVSPTKSLAFPCLLNPVSFVARQNLAFLFTKITPEQMVYMWNVLTAIFTVQCLMIVSYCLALASFPEHYWTCTLCFGIPFAYICIQQILGIFFWKKPDVFTFKELLLLFFPERRFVAGFFRRLLAYLTPDISHTYPSHHTYPTHIRSKRIPPIRIPPRRIRSTRIPPVRIHSMRIHSNGLHQQVLLTYPFKTYPTNTYPCYAYPFNAYPFKRCASAGIANVSHQYISHHYVSVQHVSHQYGSIQCVSMQKVCISRNGNEYEYHCMSFHTIATRREW